MEYDLENLINLSKDSVTMHEKLIVEDLQDEN